MKNGYEIARVPKVGKCFEVKPLSINQKLFAKKRKNEEEEATREFIVEAFKEMQKYPEKYSRKFKIMVPKDIETGKSVAELKELACKLGDHNADWVEQSLEWAQRIQNGESWEDICDDCYSANYYRRLVTWCNGEVGRLVGGTTGTPFDMHYYMDYEIPPNAVPLVVSYEE